MSSELTAVYIAIGYEGARALDKERYERQAEMSNGHIGIMAEICDLAQKLTRWLDDQTFDFPGVWEYEIAEAIGVWLFFHGDVSFDELLAHAKDVTLKWIDQNRLEYNAITKALHEKQEST